MIHFICYQKSRLETSFIFRHPHRFSSPDSKTTRKSVGKDSHAMPCESSHYRNSKPPEKSNKGKDVKGKEGDPI